MITVPELPREMSTAHVQPPVVYVDPIWEYHYVVRSLAEGNVPDQAELNALGAQGWELAGLYADAQSVHLYFKRLAR